MLSFLNIFCCCSSGGQSSKSSQQQDEVDESTRLIPDIVTEQPPSSPALVHVDHERLRERLGTIVRAKEGKMVNVIKKSHLRSRTHYDTLGLAAGRTTSPLPSHTTHLGIDPDGEESDTSIGNGQIDRLDVLDRGLPRGKSPTPSAKDIFAPQENVKLSLSWED